VNAIPSDLRVPRTGRSGNPILREDADASGPPARRFIGVADSASEHGEGGSVAVGMDAVGGTRPAMTADRGACFARSAAQGRSGSNPRPVASHLDFQHSPSAPTRPASCAHRPRPGGTRRRSSSRFPAQSLASPSISVGARGAKLVPSAERLSLAARARGRTRGKGVLAA